ncbi:hypothetical protein AAFC00_001968 [Neodothiora populina]|uniref:Phosphatidylethanolamine-binding protein n=1 Tax=Neodothiora populina TaxID=2781224 RepID=A0ABR3PQR0_9PEZI
MRTFSELTNIYLWGLLLSIANCQTPAGFVPQTKNGMTILFGDREVSVGSYIPKQVAAVRPEIMHVSPIDTPLMAIMIDPTQPDQQTPAYPQLLYWFQPNLTETKSQDMVYLNYTDSEALTPYLGPQPVDDGRLHTYIILLFRQPSNYTVSSRFPTSFAEFAQRQHFQLEEYAIKTGMGDPVAATYFLSAVNCVPMAPF